jgi:hypothetical protein
MADDSFEAARKIFFGIEGTTPGQTAFPDKVVEPQKKTIVNEFPPAACESERARSDAAGP